MGVIRYLSLEWLDALTAEVAAFDSGSGLGLKADARVVAHASPLASPQSEVAWVGAADSAGSAMA